jgi:uncharacterized repeat protein (TIGR03803 family)
VLTGSALAQSKYQILHSFHLSGNVGVGPGDMISDNAGNLYGTTGSGGKYGFGTVYELKPPATSGRPWTATTIYGFPIGDPYIKSAVAGWLILDQSGNLYGVTAYGGQGCNGRGCGTVFRLAPPKGPGSGWTETTLYSFSAWDGWQPGGLALDTQGNLYGTTYGGGRGCSALGCGTVFKLTPATHKKAWTRTVIHFFKGVPSHRGNGDGAGPFDVIFDQKGDLYGVTASGGQCDGAGCYGAAFELKPPTRKGYSWTESVLYRFGRSEIGDQLNSGVVLDKSGALYGGTQNTLYQLAFANGVWSKNVLISGNYNNYNGVILDGAGKLYGTTLNGGQYNNGAVFKLSPPGKGDGTWTQTVLHAFAGGRDGSFPDSGVTFGLDDELYGTTGGGGALGYGTVFRVGP